MNVWRRTRSSSRPSSTSTTPRSPRSTVYRAVTVQRAKPRPLKVTAPLELGSRSCSSSAIGLASVRKAAADAGWPSRRAVWPAISSVAGAGSVTTRRSRSGGTSSPVARYVSASGPANDPDPLATLDASSENRTPRRCSIALTARMTRSRPSRPLYPPMTNRASSPATERSRARSASRLTTAIRRSRERSRPSSRSTRRGRRRARPRRPGMRSRRARAHSAARDGPPERDTARRSR